MRQLFLCRVLSPPWSRPPVGHPFWIQIACINWPRNHKSRTCSNKNKALNHKKTGTEMKDTKDNIRRANAEKTLKEAAPVFGCNLKTSKSWQKKASILTTLCLCALGYPLWFGQDKRGPGILWILKLTFWKEQLVALII